ncbi:hypothetical protein D3C87_1015500 [compost metagenome]
MIKVKKRVIILSVMLIIASLIYFSFVVIYGDPFKKENFKYEVSQYLNSNYKDLEWEIVSLNYSFKSKEFQANVATLTHDLTFSVYQYEGGIYDDYAAHLWEREIQKESYPLLVKLFKSPVKVTINVLGQVDTTSYSNIPNYSMFSKELADRTKITFTGDFKHNDNDKILQIIKWLMQSKYLADIEFRSNHFIVKIPFSDLKEIKQKNELNKYIVN